MFTAAKDAVTSRAAQGFINPRIARYGEVRSLKLDSKARTIDLVCQLVGESEPVTVRVEGYELRAGGEGQWLRLGPCRSSRPWLENLLNDFGRDREIPVPGWVAAALG